MSLTKVLLMLVNNYLNMKNAFVDADTLKIKLNGQKFITAIDSIKA